MPKYKDAIRIDVNTIAITFLDVQGTVYGRELTIYLRNEDATRLLRDLKADPRIAED